MHPFVATCEESMKKKIEFLEKELGKVRTGRASIAIVDGIRVNYYGTPTPLNQVASVSTPDARTIVISPFEKKVLGDIEKAIQIADIGIQPNNDGNVIRLPIPPLNEERRKEIAKTVHKIGEDAKVSIRKIRQDLNAKIKKSEKDKELAEDESIRMQKEVQTFTDHFIKLVDQKVEKKSKEVLTL
jgi:ribosome recycling factor